MPSSSLTSGRFDLGFLRAAILEQSGETFEPVVVDTARLARRLVRGEVRDLKLATLARHFRSRTLPEHRALADARATVDVLHGLIERGGSLGATTLEDLRDLSVSTSDKRFRRISLVRDAPSTCGVYRFLDARGEVLYVGKATDLRIRLRTYFGQDRRRRIEDLVRETQRVTWTPTPTLIEAEVREVREIHHHLPRYNRRSKRAPTPVYIALTSEAFSRLSIVATPRDTHRHAIGPLPSRRVAESIVAALQTAVPLRTCTDRLRVAQDHAACVMKDLGHCGAPCDGTQSRHGYAALVERVAASFEDPAPLLEGLRERMVDLAASGSFERAGEVRGQLHTTARTLLSLRRRQALVDVPELVLSRDRGSASDVVIIRHGRLAGTLRFDANGDRDDPWGGHGTIAAWGQFLRERLALTPLETFDDPPTARDVEEIDLLLEWIGAHDSDIAWATDGYAEPLAGGRQLAEATAEARWVARAVRRDRQALTGAKVARRAPTIEQRTG